MIRWQRNVLVTAGWVAEDARSIAAPTEAPLAILLLFLIRYAFRCLF